MTCPLFQREWDESRGLHHIDFLTYIEANYDDEMCGSIAGQTAVPDSTPSGRSN